METRICLELNGVAFNYPSKKNLDSPSKPFISNLNLRLCAGEIVSICGKNGSGKSTLLNIIAGFINPIAGGVIRAKSDGEIFGAMVFQELGLLEWKNSFENVGIGVISARLTDVQKEKIILDNMALLGIIEHKNKLPKELSGGLKQRVAIARALASSPKVLLLDEPFSALDWNVKERLIKDLRKILKSKNISAVFVTHNPDDALLISDRVLALNKGTLIEVENNLNTKHSTKYFESNKFASARKKLIKSIA
jgi:ABC-type nitrate/sulfonate/bicarbonate transport system ATPase subunit